MTRVYGWPDSIPPLTNVSKFVMQRSMFIGCGGLGSNAINLLKHRIKDYMGEDALKECMALKFLSVDSAHPGDRDAKETDLILDPNREMIGLALDGWQELVKEHPGVRSWFPHFETELSQPVRERILEKFSSAGDGCATTRIFGRLGLFKDGNAKKIYEHIKKFAMENVQGQRYELSPTGQKIAVERSDTVSFFIVSSLGGGTGTGIFMDVAAIIRKVQDDIKTPKGWRIIGIFVLPTLLSRWEPSGTPERVNANSYAAIKELHHFLDRNPFDAQYDPQGRMHARCENTTPATFLFDVPYLIEGINDTGLELDDRNELCGLVSGMLFKMTMTDIGRLFWERGIDGITGGGVLSDEVPASSASHVIDPQKPSFCDFGWATLHVPLEIMLQHARMSAVEEIIKRLASVEDNEEASKVESDDLDINQFFLSPKAGTEKNKFVDKVGLSGIVNPSFWTRFSQESGSAGIGGASNEIGVFDLGFLRHLLQSGDINGLFHTFMKKTRGEIEDDAGKRKNNDLDETRLKEEVEKFLCETLSWDKKGEHGKEPIPESKLSKAIESVFKENTPGFVLQGLFKLNQVIGDLCNRSNRQIDHWKAEISALRHNRDKKFTTLVNVNDELLTAIPFFGKRRLEMVLKNFLSLDIRYKSLIFQKRGTEEIVLEILPAYSDQIGKWYRKIQNIKKKAGVALDEIEERERRLLDGFARERGNDFAIPFDATTRQKFFNAYKKVVKVDELLDAIRKDGLTYQEDDGAIPREYTFSALLDTETPSVIIELVTGAVEAEEQKAKSRGEMLFESGFDAFTGSGNQALFTDRSGGDIEQLHGELIRNSAPMTCVNNFSGKPLAYSFSSSKVWQGELNDNPLSGEFNHKVTQVHFRLGIAPYQLKYIEDWYEDYKPLLQKTEPLHLFPEARYWQEPHTDFFFEKNPEALFQFAQDKDFGPPYLKHEEGNDEWFLTRKPEIDRFQGNHCEFHLKDDAGDIIYELQSNEELYEEIAVRVLKEIQNDTSKLKGIIGSGAIPARLLHRLPEYQGVVGKASEEQEGAVLKNSEALFEIAFDLGIVKETDGNTYEVFIYNRPKRTESDYTIHGSKESFLKEFAFNEAFYERICDLIVKYVYSNNLQNDARRKDLYQKMCDAKFLPPYQESVLRDEYKIS